MAHYAEIDENNIVVRVLVVPEEQEHRAQEHLTEDLGLGGTWIKTSYNTRWGVHNLGGTPLRGNFAGQGYIYDPVTDAFYPPKPFPSWVLNPEQYNWVAPKPKPAEMGYIWNEDTQEWVDKGE